MASAFRARAASLWRSSKDLEAWVERLYPYRRLRLTRAGWFFLVVTIAIGLAALNTGHNLFYLVFAMLVSLIVVSGLLSEGTVRRLRVERRIPAEVFARAETLVELRVQNRSGKHASYAVEIRDAVAAQPRRRVGFLDRLDPGTERSFFSLWSFPCRGRHDFRSVHLVTRFPFGLFEKTRIVPVRESCVVYPAVNGAAARRLSREVGDNAFRKHRLGEEVIGLRRKLPDDDFRRIHWRVSARIGDWMVIEHAQTLDRPVSIFFDNRGPAGERFEAAVEWAACLAWAAGRGGRAAVSLFSWGRSFREDGPTGLRAALAFLAEVQPISGERPPGDRELREWRQDVERHGGGVFVTAGEPPDLPAGTVLRVA
jgi:uncharacterized protein (DUF58 family)